MKDANGMAVAYTYYAVNYDGLGTLTRDHLSKDEARRIAANIAKLPDLMKPQNKA